jgi:hypothetical protein
MEWLEPALRNETYGLIALGIGAATLLPATFFGLLTLWFRWRASRLAKLTRRFRGRRQLAEEQLSSMAAEEKDIERMINEMERAKKKA